MKLSDLSGEATRASVDRYGYCVEPPAGYHVEHPVVEASLTISPERAIALRDEMIRLAHLPNADPDMVVSRAETYFQYIVNGAKPL